MWIDNENFGTRTVYGYAVDGVPQANMSFDDSNNTWWLDVGTPTIREMVVKGDTGRVGISTLNPQATLDVNGSVRIGGSFVCFDDTPEKPNGGSWSGMSDRRLKKNVQDLEGTLEKLLKLRCLKAAMNADCDGQMGLLDLAGNATLLYYMSEEGQEGRNAFNEKRPPDFSKFTRNP